MAANLGATVVKESFGITRYLLEISKPAWSVSKRIAKPAGRILTSLKVANVARALKVANVARALKVANVARALFGTVDIVKGSLDALGGKFREIRLLGALRVVSGVGDILDAVANAAILLRVLKLVKEAAIAFAFPLSIISCVLDTVGVVIEGFNLYYTRDTLKNLKGKSDIQALEYLLKLHEKKVLSRRFSQLKDFPEEKIRDIIRDNKRAKARKVVKNFKERGYKKIERHQMSIGVKAVALCASPLLFFPPLMPIGFGILAASAIFRICIAVQTYRENKYYDKELTDILSEDNSDTRDGKSSAKL